MYNSEAKNNTERQKFYCFKKILYNFYLLSQLNMLSATTENATRLLTSQTTESRPLQRTVLPNLLIIQCKFFFISLAERPPHDLQITAHK